MNKKKIVAFETVIIIVLAVVIGLLIYSNVRTTEKYKKSIENNKAFVYYYDQLTNENTVFKASIEQLKYYGDSVTEKLLESSKELNIKDKNIKALQYHESQFKKQDTLLLNDTIFINPSFNLDTIIGDEWMSTEVLLSYPNFVSVSPQVVSKKQVIIHSSKETINPPKKFFLFRWFQKKHSITKVNVNEENPYIINEDNLFINVE